MSRWKTAQDVDKFNDCERYFDHVNYYGLTGARPACKSIPLDECDLRTAENGNALALGKFNQITTSISFTWSVWR